MNSTSGSALRERIAAGVLELSSADQTEVLVSTSDTALTRFTHEMSNQNVAAADLGISVRAILSGRTGVAQTNRFDEESLRDVVARASAIAALAPEDPLQGELPCGGPARAPDNAYDLETAQAGAERREGMCDAIFREAESAGYWLAGFVATSSSGLTVANTSGTLASFDGTYAAANVKKNAPDSTGFGEAYRVAIGAIDANAARRRQSRRRGPRHSRRPSTPATGP